MRCVIDRGHVVVLREVVAILSVRRRGARSRVVLADNGLYHTLTRPQTFVRCVGAAAGAIAEVGAKAARVYHYRKGARWQGPQP